MSFSIFHQPEMKNSQRTGVRQYNKSEFPRLRWTPELHDHFVEVVERLGGKYRATPKRILQMMSVKGLKISHVKSHLQMYRNMKGCSNINILVPMKHLCEERANFNANGFFPISSSQRLTARNELREWELDRRGFEPNVFHEESDGLQIMEETGDYEQQDTQTSLLSGTSKEEDVGPKEICELSLSFATSPLMRSKEDQESWPLNNIDHTRHLNATTRKFINIPHFQSLRENRLNLDLTISTCFSHSN